MTTLTVTLPEDLDRFVEEQVRSGAAPDAAEVVRLGVQRLKDASDSRARFRAKIQQGLDDFDNGRFEVVDDVEQWLEDIHAEVEAAFAEP